MVDIRAVCKVFLDFVYDNKILPNDIVDILENYQSKWDFRLLCDILNYKDKCYQKNETDEYTVKSEISRYRNLLKDVNIWRTLEHQRKLKYLHDACNDFFHNVTTNDEEFINMIKSLLSSTSEKYNKDSYVNKINLFSACNAVITKKLEETKAQLITTQKESKMGGVETSSSKNKEKTTYKENEWTRTSAEKYIVAYFFSNYEHYDIYPTLTQTEAITKAAEILGTTFYNLKQMRDQFDAHYRDIPFEDRETRKKMGRRIGYVAPLCSTQQKIKDNYDMKSQDEVISIVKDILGINR